jgi:PepB aminopeptidase
MPNSSMPIALTSQTAPDQWGSAALLSADQQGMTIHLPAHDPLLAIQQAGRCLANLGIQAVSLSGTDWNLESCWVFWLGFRDAKQQQTIEWPHLSPEQQQQRQQRQLTIDWVRDLINRPADTLGPQQLAQEAIALLQKVSSASIQYQLLSGEALKQQGYHGLYNVGRGSDREPVLLTLDYNPTNQPNAPVLACLVGKGITFDSGGYSLKPSKSMETMKADMGGAALVTASLALAAARGLKQRVKLFLCCADNLVSGHAYTLGDVIHYRNGKTVEVVDSDAEGRLVLADGLIDASLQQPQVIIDCATLTGAAKIALGTDYHALLTLDDQLAQQLLATAAEEREPFWRLPLEERHRHQLPSHFADLSNVAASAHTAGASTAAGFLSHFVTPYQQKWLHIDCSASYRKIGVKQWATGATGIGVRTIAAFLLKLAANTNPN